MEILRNLLSNESKPEKITPLDLALTSYLVTRKVFDHEIFDSQSTLAVRLNVDHKSIKRSLDRLEELRWITCRSQGNGLPKAISVNLENLPAAQPLRAKITPDAGRLVDFYLEMRKPLGKRLPKNGRQRQLPSAQRFITRYGSYENAAAVVYALFHHQDSGIRAKTRQSLYNALNVLPKARRLQERARGIAAMEEAAWKTESEFGIPTLSNEEQAS